MKNDQIQTLNYCAHAIEDLRETAAGLQLMMPNSARVLYRLIVLLQNSVKFILPNCCNLVEPDDIRQAHMDLLRLPYPCVAFEAPWDNGEKGPEYVGEFEQTLATKRIALCWDARQFEPMPGLNRFLDIFEKGGVFVLPIFWTPKFKKWTVALGGAFIPYENEVKAAGPSDAKPAMKIVHAAKMAAGHVHAKSKQFRGEPFSIFPEIYEEAIATYGSRDKANAQIIIDSHDETMILIQACSVINCANVMTDDIEASTALNRKRKASGKQPFFSYKVLELTEERKVSNRGRSGGQHISPRMHLRRGHLRQLDRKVVWVRPAMINAESTRGVVHKEYGIVPAQSK